MTEPVLKPTTGGDDVSQQQSGPVGPREDDELKHETRGLEQGGHSTHAEEWREPEPAGEDQPTGDEHVVPEWLEQGTPPGMTPRGRRGALAARSVPRPLGVPGVA